MFDINNLLQSLAGESAGNISEKFGHLAVGKRKPNGPPPMVLTPSQQAMQDVKTGAEQVIAPDAMPDDNYGVGSKQGAGLSDIVSPGADMGSGIGDKAKGAFGSLSSGWDKIMSAPATQVVTPTMYGNAPRDRALAEVAGFRRFGGPVDKDKPYVVGEDGPEIVVPTDDGQVVSNDEMKKHLLSSISAPQNIQDSPTPPMSETMNREQIPMATPENQVMPYGLAQTERSPLDRDIDQTRAEYMEAQKIGPASKWQKFGNIAAALVTAGDNYFNHKDQPVRTYQEIKRDKRSAPLREKLATLLGQKEFETTQAYKRKQIENIDADNQYNRDRLKQMAETADQKAVDTAAANIFKAKTFDPTNPAQAAMAVRAKLDPTKMGKWDFSNPVKAVVNGLTFDYDRITGEWNPSGLPASEKDKIVSLDISVPGEKNADGTQKIRKFNVPQSQAATMSNALQAAGMQIEAAKNRQDDQQQFQLKHQQIAAQLQKELEDHKALIAAGKEKEAEESKKRILDYQKQLVESLKK